MGPFITKPRGESCRQITRNSYLSHRELYEGRRLLPVRRNEALPPALPAKEVTKVALRLKYQIEQVIPCELDEDSVTKANSNILTKAVIQTTREAVKCIKYVWHGWLCQDDKDPSTFIEYPERVNTKYWSHVNPDRLRAPIYQNTVQIFFSLLYLVLYTIVINTINPSGDLDIVEGILYIMTLGFVCDEFAKFWKVGRFYFGFWNAFNSTLYILLVISFILRIVALTRSPDSGDAERIRFNALSYNFLAFSAPMFWGRILLYLDTFRFFGAMLVVLKVMMKESLIFFALLGVVIIGFLQGFMGMDQADPKNAMTASNILQGMANSVMQSPDFGVFQEFAAPFGILLYYFFTFVVMVILLNILIALYNSAYEDITGNAIDEYMALFAQRTLQFVRAPDENVFIAPLNLIEIFLLIIPFEWWLPSARYERLNHYVMGIIYSPLLLITALIETLNARRIRLNRRLGEEDDDILQEWEEAAQNFQRIFRRRIGI
ncbi:conserved hypothetical protein [Histoplasma mississippiense (nom. inval.)]|uniref:conserved hypothetical protein n=1 Tax=Ajellomyces capsulatus (strain NAm1 / WU24) TaxID=2059318 RepID=UPI000157B869|nr:conserved hypothetical protein [Histoplasma mississippiense (nom. inval.)]EDN03271.1 conserved hypothetical protein [Histoplasma mississippiense (nom. inval.)]